MQTRAAIAHAAGRPPHAVPPDLGRPKPREALAGIRSSGDVPKAGVWCADGRLTIDALLTHTMPLARTNDALDLMHAGGSIRGVVLQ